MKTITLVSSVIFILLIGFSVVLAQQVESDEGYIKNGTVGSTTFLGSASQQSIEAARQYLWKKLGENYYNQFVIFELGEAYRTCIETGCEIRNIISFSYKIPFETVGDPQLGPPPEKIYVTVDEQGVIINYEGPAKPYQFLITAEEAMARAQSYGLKDIKAAVLSQALTSEGSEIIWAVSSNEVVDVGEVLGESIYRGVYVDVDSGEIRGEYRINPLVHARDNGVKLGEFLQEDKKPQEEKNPQAEEPEFKGRQKENIFTILASFVVATGCLLAAYLLIRGRKR